MHCRTDASGAVADHCPSYTKGAIVTEANRNTDTSQGRKITRVTARVTAGTKATKQDQRPEWTTERWKQRVEAEARRLLKREVRNLGAARR
jgi:hypothetical protein